MSDTVLDSSGVDELLEILLAQLKPSEMRAVIQKIGRHFRQKNRTRISQQQNADGAPYTPRKKVSSPGSLNTATFEYNGRIHKVFIMKRTGSSLLGYYVRPDSGTNYRWFDQGKMSDVTYGKERPNKKMLLGFRRYLKMKSSTGQQGPSVTVGYFGVGRAAYTHHSGQTEDGIRYPARELIGLPEEDKREALDMLNEYVAETLS